MRRGAARVHPYGDGSTLELAEISPAWVPGRWFREEPEWCLAAYTLAGSI